MKKIFLVIMMLGFVYQSVKPVAATDYSAIIGSWKCAVNDVPYEYSKSTISFTEKEGKLSGVVKFENGSEVIISSIKFTNNQLILSLSVDGNPVVVTGKVDGNKITGSVDTTDSKVDFIANKVVEKK